MSTVVRKATPADRDGLCHLLRMMHAENGVFTVSEPKVNWFLDRMFYPERIPPGDMGVRGYCGVIGPPEALEGFIMMMLGSNWYSEELHLEELANFVHPDYRKLEPRHAQTLIKYAKHLSDKIGIPLVIGIISNTRTEAKVRMYKQMLPMAGAFFIYNADTNRFRIGTNGERREAS